MTIPTFDIQQAIQNVELTFARGNASELAELYTHNAMLLPPEFSSISSKRDIGAFWQGGMDMGIASVEFDVVEVEQHGDTAIEVSNFTMKSADGQVIDQGKGTVIWKFENGAWKIHRDMWNTSVGLH